ncbi:unnamed protein product [Rangifer tarandus platyrhynchus]|uniref:Uncharacterized protein n=2 Tax=Rangifer tarandus platyrhynchus TaxID=3082113 RepID=A0ACB0FHS8_RANTA|nr:unnamed protein product [Rangifer tarandus platyrhynchus]CAI9712564.1 unnamed protein product [Rangifer tarandus platyrhynchus]
MVLSCLAALQVQIPEELLFPVAITPGPPETSGNGDQMISHPSSAQVAALGGSRPGPAPSPPHPRSSGSHSPNSKHTQSSHFPVLIPHCQGRPHPLPFNLGRLGLGRLERRRDRRNRQSRFFLPGRGGAQGASLRVRPRIGCARARRRLWIGWARVLGGGGIFRMCWRR